MGMKNSNDLPPISETLFIPLAARAAETTRDHPIISDEKSVEILKTINIKNKVTDGGQISTLGILSRTKIIDEEVSKILSQNAAATIINLGAGLDTRLKRIDNGLLKWYDLDLPDVIQFRRRFFPECERVRFIANLYWILRGPNKLTSPKTALLLSLQKVCSCISLRIMYLISLHFYLNNIREPICFLMSFTVIL